MAGVQRGCQWCLLLAPSDPAVHLQPLVPERPGKATAGTGKWSHPWGQWEWFGLWDQGRANDSVGRGHR